MVEALSVPRHWSRIFLMPMPEDSMSPERNSVVAMSSLRVLELVLVPSTWRHVLPAVGFLCPLDC